MRWEHKARIQRVCASLPGGALLYREIQRRAGRLDADPFKRVPRHAEMVRRLGELGLKPEGLRCVEIGTGHLPVAPVAFHLVGASEVVTVDLHRRLHPGLTTRMLRRLAAAEDRLVELYDGVVEPGVLRDRLRVVAELADRPAELFRRIGVRYLAPADAARLPRPGGSFDLSFSMTVLEHVTPPVLRGILAESRRLLHPDGFAAHLIDPSDHFAHQDPAISRINFLRFSDREWRRVGGNEFGYCNRLRASELERMVTDAGFVIERCYREVDERSRAEVDNGFPVHPDFRQFAATDLCTTEVEIYARPDQSGS